MGAPLAVQERITDSRTIRRAVALMEELTGYHFRPRAAEATLPKLSEVGKAAPVQPRLSNFPKIEMSSITPFTSSRNDLAGTTLIWPLPALHV
jgi:TnpA family transposase